MPDDAAELELELAVTKKPRERIDLLLTLSEMLHEEDPPRAMELAREALGLSRQLGDKKRTASAFRFLGLATVMSTEPEEGIRLLERAIESFEELDDEQSVAICCYTLATAHMYAGRYRQSFELLARSGQICERVSNERLASRVHNVMGVAYRQVGEYPKALEHFLLSEGLAMRCGALADAALAANNVGTIYDSLGDRDAELECYQRGLDLSLAAGDELNAVVCLMNIAEINRQRGAYDAARECIERAERALGENGYPRYKRLLMIQASSLEFAMGFDEKGVTTLRSVLTMSEDAGDTYVMGMALEHLGGALLRLGSIDEALRTSLRAIDLAISSGEQESQMKAEMLASRCCEAAGDLRGALDHHRRGVELSNRIHGAERQRILLESQMRSEIERAENEREIFRLKNEQLEMAIDHKTRELGALALHLVEKNNVLDSLRRELAAIVPALAGETKLALRRALKSVEANIASERDWDAFEAQFELLHRDFIATLSKRHPELSRTELKVCALLKINLSTKEIATILSLSTKTVDSHRYNIRKKLALPPELHLGSYLAGV